MYLTVLLYLIYCKKTIYWKTVVPNWKTVAPNLPAQIGTQLRQTYIYFDADITCVTALPHKVAGKNRCASNCSTVMTQFFPCDAKAAIHVVFVPKNCFLSKSTTTTGKEYLLLSRCTFLYPFERKMPSRLTSCCWFSTLTVICFIKKPPSVFHKEAAKKPIVRWAVNLFFPSFSLWHLAKAGCRAIKGAVPSALFMVVVL